MRRSLIPVAAVCAMALLTSSAWAQTPAPPAAPTPAPPSPPAPPAPLITPEVPEPSPPSDPDPAIGEPSRNEEDPSRVTPVPTGSSAPADPPPGIWWDIGYRYPGTYSTARLLSLMDAIRRTGRDQRHASPTAAPFIVAGYARFWDSWGEVRHAETSLRPHLGQDVFCSYGAPVLAAESGTLEYGQDASGGLVARVHRGDGSYWYYAHLSRFGPDHSTGDRVGPGDVIGHCGTSGNAAGTEPHVHFGFFVNHVARNPMGALIEWLRQAESHASRLLRKLHRRPSAGPRPATKPPVRAALASVPGAPCYPPLPEGSVELVAELLEPTL